ncbi:putative phosphatidylethanolamine-binding protein [Talaromyces proteolyticus]|uniref:Phosphatidylethanolamine-binding protein n=1 Tax=Talaromyces proteolyticus TaxID=1131652 RepID=A0AAD4KSI4_9EURO|nr:putative phosphatidylethanolamine-binding protein [Talaromyces proteolyticus]KAH8700108.1 putative phosphatidylethanolamine-binding protein [Talaromyces proteolyticus]
MPDISKHESILEGLINGTYHTLGLSIGSHKVVTPGEKIAKRDTHGTPKLLAPPGFPQGVYAIISIDIDAPFITWNVLSPAAHWIQTGLKSAQGSQELTSDEPAIASWVGAGPPPGAAPHRYAFFLYLQKPDSIIPPNLREGHFGLMQRMRFDVDAMARQLGLGEIVAVNYFVSN